MKQEESTTAKTMGQITEVEFEEEMAESLKLPKMSTNNKVILMSTSRLSRISYHNSSNYDNTCFHKNVSRLLNIKSYLNERQQQQQQQQHQQQQRRDGRLSATTSTTLLPRINNNNQALLSNHENSATRYHRTPTPTPPSIKSTPYHQRHYATLKLPPIRTKKKDTTTTKI